MLMIGREAIKEVYKKYRKKPKSVDDLEVRLLFDSIAEVHNLEIVDEKIVIGSIDEKSLFHKISLKRVYGIVNFEETVAIVLHSSILFLNKLEPQVSIHLKPQPKTFWQKVKMWFSQ